MDEFAQDAAALIIGVTVQGLAVARSLAKHGIKVYAVERHRNNPATKSRYLTLFVREGVNPEALPDTLLELRAKISESKVVLLACSDKTVRAIAGNWDRLADAYLLSWGDCTESLASFTYKSAAYSQAAKTGIDYPKARLIRSMDDCGSVASMRFPMIVKPDQPPGTFKTRKVHDIEQLKHVVIDHEKSLPFVVQECIEGEDDRLQFCTLFMDKGRALACVTGRKRRSFPKGLGRGTVMELHQDGEIREKTMRFLKGLSFSGPVSVEFKRDSNGRPWMIEPNVGRTEYCVDLTIQSGLNLPYLEICYSLGIDCREALENPVDYDVIWYDTDAEPFCYFEDCLRQRTFKPWGKRPVFLYFGHLDIWPIISSYFYLLEKAVDKAVIWLQKKSSE